MEQCSVSATGILAFDHAAQHLWKSAAAWLYGRTTQARRWFGWARHRLRHGRPDGVLADLAEALEVEGVPATARATLRFMTPTENDDMVIATAQRAHAAYIVSRANELLALQQYEGIV